MARWRWTAAAQRSILSDNDDSRFSTACAPGVRMRLITDILIALMLAVLLGGGAMYYRQNQRVEADLENTRLELKRFQQQVHLQGALGEIELSERGYPLTIDPAWFGGNLPGNSLLQSEHPWVEIAGGKDHKRMHPRDLVAVDETTAAFWYNPHHGLVRARVPIGVSDERALEMYNQLNDCELMSLFSDG
jgi:hypothetical protein